MSKNIIMSSLYPIFEAFPKAVYQMDISRKLKRIVKCLVCHVTLQQFPRRTDSLQDILPTLEHDRNTWKVADLCNGCFSEIQSWISLKIHSKLAKNRAYFYKCDNTDAPLPHLVTTGSEVFSKGLDGAGFVVLYQLCQACVCLVVSRYDKLSILVLGNDKMATPVVTPWEEKHIVSRGQSDSECQWKSNKSPAMGRLDDASLVGQDESKGFVTETNEETAQVFISQQIFCVPGGQRQTQAIKQKCLIF